MSDTTALVLIAGIAAVFFPLLLRHARAIDTLEETYRLRIRDHHPDIALDRKRGGVQYLVIHGVVYPSSVIDFRARCKQEPERVDAIIDEYLASVPGRYRDLGRARTAG
jgi:hypothetical protein